MMMLVACSTSRQNVREKETSVVPTIPVPVKHEKQKVDHTKDNGWWGKAYNDEKPWVTNVSRTNSITQGLAGRHISLWASHGRYFKAETDKWEWQRPYLFGTTEDLFTQSFVVPYIIPMLENAGAIVFTPRERDWQPNEVVIDNDSPHIYTCNGKVSKTSNKSGVKEYNEVGKWKTVEGNGFSLPKDGFMHDGEMPFTTGTARFCNTTKGSATHFVEYTPDIPEEGDYAVYVSYKSIEGSVDDAHYTVFHSDVATEFHVNQQMGGGTWVYLGTFHFNKKADALNCVVLDNHSNHNGKVTTDAVRFGGGMGTVMRGNKLPVVSGLPRFDEGARYYCQWAGAPYSIYSQRGGTDDYADDINSRSMMTNWLAGGSCFVPDTIGLRVPLELCLAFHSNAGFNSDFKSIYGSLGICTTDFNDGKLAAGHPRTHSRDLADMLVKDLTNDMKRTYGTWNFTELYDRNYSETRRPEMPSAILEMLSHQSFPDMKLAHDPQFKFVLARSVYKSILRYVSKAHGKPFVVQPLAPHNLRSTLASDGRLTLTWDAQRDSLEQSAVAKSFKIYIAKGDGDFDNGCEVTSNSVSIPLNEGIVYRFRITALNEGGESFRSEEMAAVYRPGKPVVLVANGFHRLASPKVVNDYPNLGFDLNADPGLSYGKTPVWAGAQQVFATSKAKDEGPGTFGFCGDELEGGLIAGNDFNYTTTHVKAIAATFGYSAVSCSASALPTYYHLNDYSTIDLILGNERNDGYSLSAYKALPAYLTDILSKYNGGIFVSGSYIASDAESEKDKSFLSSVLHVEPNGSNNDRESEIHGMGMTFGIHRSINATHYASTSSDVLTPTNGAFPTLAYTNGQTAAIAFGNKTFVMGFPFECIQQPKDRNVLMAAILKYITSTK